MKILMLSWEYPPKTVGGLSEHVYFLSQELSKLGEDIHVITCEEGTAPEESCDNGVCVHRVLPFKLQNEDFIKWVMHLNFAILEKAIKLITELGRFDIIHAHDWLTLYSARVLKNAYSIPLVCTIHSTENGRNNGIRTEMQGYISSAEWTLTYEAWKIITCCHYMKQEVNNLFVVPMEKIWVIPNGADPQVYHFDFDWLPFRRQYAMDQEKLIFYVGRHVYEKGIHVLADASYKIINEFGHVKFIIAGTGPMTNEIKNKVYSMGVQDKFIFPGYIDTDTKNKLYRVADAAVFPSLYEPFGIVALEAMAAGCPVVVSDTGGLGELIQHGENGLKALTGVAESLADNVIRLLRNEETANYLKRNALKSVREKYAWDKIAVITNSMYHMVKEEEKSLQLQ
jgi:glycogen(starch) synthase